MAFYLVFFLEKKKEKKGKERKRKGKGKGKGKKVLINLLIFSSLISQFSNPSEISKPIARLSVKLLHALFSFI